MCPLVPLLSSPVKEVVPLRIAVPPTFIDCVVVFPLKTDDPSKVAVPVTDQPPAVIRPKADVLF